MLQDCVRIILTDPPLKQNKNEVFLTYLRSNRISLENVQISLKGLEVSLPPSLLHLPSHRHQHSSVYSSDLVLRS